MAAISTVDALFLKYRDDVYRLALSYTHSREEAEDVCQTVFLKRIGQKEIEPNKEKAWLLQVTANECKSLLRSAWWKKTVALDETRPAEEPAFDTTLAALLALKPKYRVVLYLHYYEDYPTDEIARLLHISRSAVTTRLSRARQALREILKEV